MEWKYLLFQFCCIFSGLVMVTYLFQRVAFWVLLQSLQMCNRTHFFFCLTAYLVSALPCKWQMFACCLILTAYLVVYVFFQGMDEFQLKCENRKRGTDGRNEAIVCLAGSLVYYTHTCLILSLTVAQVLCIATIHIYS